MFPLSRMLWFYLKNLWAYASVLFILISSAISAAAEVKLNQTFLKSSLYCTPINKKFSSFTLYASGLLVEGVFIKPLVAGDRYKNEAEVKVYPNRKISYKYKYVGDKSEIHQLTTSGKIQPFTKNVKLSGQFKIDGNVTENCQIDVTFYDDPFEDPDAEKLANLERELALIKQQNSTDDSTLAKDKIVSAQVPTQEWFANTKNADEQFGSLTRETDAFLCTTALDITRQKWNDVASSAAYVVEAQRRAFGVNDCRRRLGLVEIDVPEQAKSNQQMASSPITAQMSLLDICNAALDPNKMSWNQNSDMQIARKQAEGLGLSPPLCRTILGLDKSPESGQKLSEQVQVSSKSTKPNEIKKSSNRVALIIANTRYREQVPLINPENDATLIAQSLKSAGFSQVIVKTDLTFAQSMEAIRDFREISDKADWSVVYYSGHGIGFNGIN